MSANLFTNGSTSVQMATNPSRGYGERRTKRQAMGFNSAGEQYIYVKNPLTGSSFTVAYPRCTAAIRDALLSFRGIVGGDPFTWYDHASTAHTVRFASSEIRCRQVTPTHHRLEISLEKDSA